MQSILLSFIVLFFVSCSTVTQMQTAKVLDVDKSSFAIGVGQFSSKYHVEGESDKFSFPTLEIMYRRGIFPNLDAGVRVTNGLSPAFDAKYQLMNGDLNLSTGLGVGYFSVSSGERKSTFIELKIPIFMDYNLRENFAILFTPTLSSKLMNATGGDLGDESSTIFLAGGSAGFKWGDDWGLIAEIGYAKPIAGASNANEKEPFMQYSASLFWQ
ncbi:MAG: hypothetical protein A2504_15620 [Bdellovibrionales bacterium RIFOXYD12_FULL_39_22]|nr:MAG: hypothetical protein A2385_03050 [Bdellovibrionales bacterium RIFOXYB1_FULL_39_21]OFZ43222.1 MAG: hypothetical protein A2485_12195 [Bdellovibrionales bacterium RIFOXYC12_FULL_39_17]OFZ47960.1 MAG: hypothetical protein A2404_16835 [Bdellovibrionales bacterium RIFOXYC1_FULL_39_130]OFZ73889.1 MAG: hypothetical protein A2451_06190 [Bdellovibrionales bacterium RIFOXYC2_FULL_39_8]OFZ75740.1 MAG: hypothetical protein A2560_13335 [Bdellovibrionales bacterium RIFOXYD1_FULL_39_84]OFZ94230.1 MAG: